MMFQVFNVQYQIYLYLVMLYCYCCLRVFVLREAGLYFILALSFICYTMSYYVCILLLYLFSKAAYYNLPVSICNSYAGKYCASII